MGKPWYFLVVFAMITASISIATTPVASGQDLSTQRPSFSRLTGQSALSSLGKRFGLTPTSQIPTPLILEGAVNPDEYVVGPGDEFTVTMGGALAEMLPVAISADGNLIIPDIFDEHVAGQTLASVQSSVLAALRSNFQNVDVAFTLESPRLFYVHIAGAVPEPGRFMANAISRLDDALQLAFARKAFDLERVRSGGAGLDASEFSRMIPATTSERPLIKEEYRPSLRDIIIKRADGQTDSIDLMKYYATGNLEQNPFVRDGDIIQVSSYHIMDAVQVLGDIPYPGSYPPRLGDRLSDVLSIASGSNDISSIGEVRVTSRGTDGRVSSISVHTADLAAGRTEDVTVSAGDIINVTAEIRAVAAVYGTVEFPGTYPIQAGKTTLKELIEMSGGLTEDANLSAAYVERKSSDLIKSDGRQSNLDFFGRTYLSIERRRNRLAVDVAANLSGEETVVLNSGDTVVFPPTEGTVFVTGNVAQGGYVPFVEGQPARYYIDEAGGQGTETTGVYVFEVSSGQYRQGADTIVKEGDTVFVNREPIGETPELQSLLITQETSRQQIRLATVQTVITGVSAIAAVITTVVAIRR